MEEQTPESETSDDEDVPATPPINGIYKHNALQNGHRTYSMDVDTSNNNEASPTTSSDVSIDAAQRGLVDSERHIPQISEEEKRGFRTQLVDIMREKFLSGNDVSLLTIKKSCIISNQLTSFYLELFIA